MLQNEKSNIKPWKGSSHNHDSNAQGMGLKTITMLHWKNNVFSVMHSVAICLFMFRTMGCYFIKDKLGPFFLVSVSVMLMKLKMKWSNRLFFFTAHQSNNRFLEALEGALLQ